MVRRLSVQSVHDGDLERRAAEGRGDERIAFEEQEVGSRGEEEGGIDGSGKAVDGYDDEGGCGWDICGAELLFFVEAAPANNTQGKDEYGVGKRVGDQTECAETTLVRVLESAKFEFPPDVVRNDDVPTTAEIQRDIREKGEQKGQPQPEVFSEYAFDDIVGTDPAPVRSGNDIILVVEANSDSDEANDV